MRLIDADKIRIKPEYMHDICGVAMIRVEDIARILNDMPPIELERKKGKWIDDGTELGCCCSECGTTLDDYFDGSLHEICLNKIPNFCLSCGSYNGNEEDEIAERKKGNGYTTSVIFLLETNARNVAKNVRGEQE